MLPSWAALSLYNDTKRCCYSLVEVQCFRPLLSNNALCVCEYVWSNCWELLHLIFFFTQPQTRFGFGACKGQPEPDLWNDRKIAVAPLLFHGCLNAHKAHLQAAVNSEPGGYGAGDQGGKFWALHGSGCSYRLGSADSHGCVCKAKESKAGFLGLLLQQLWWIHNFICYQQSLVTQTQFSGKPALLQ